LPPKRKLAWGNKVSAEFREKVFAICLYLGINPDYLMAAIAFETGEMFTPDVKNGAGSGATGLIQFMPKTAIGLGTTVEALAAMTAVQQLDIVRAYFEPYRGRLHTLSDVYMAILLPTAIGKPEDAVLWADPATTVYRQNSGLDANTDGKITKAEAAAKVQAKLVRGCAPANMWVEL
jgi:hypothetical protein